MHQFHDTGYGRRFFDEQLPELIRHLNRIADQLERLNTARTVGQEEWETCRFCTVMYQSSEMHRHRSGWVCENCWDERFGSTERRKNSTLAKSA